MLTEILFKKPTLFDNYIIISPSLWWDNELLLNTENIDLTAVNKIYIAVGNEGEIMERTSKVLFSKLKAKKSSVYFQFFEKKNHGNILHLAVYNAFALLFGQKE